MEIQAASKALILPCDPEEIDEFLSRPSAGAIAAVATISGPILVLGAGGKMGLHLCLMLKKAARTSHRALRVVAVSRFQTLRDRSSFAAADIETIACDLSDEKQVAALPDAPTIFFLAGIKFGTTASPKLLEQMNVVVPQIVAARYRTAQFVVFSTGCVYPFVAAASGGAAEATPPEPNGEYAESCLGREKAFTEATRLFGTRVVLIRLNYSVEFRYGVLVDIAGKILRREPIDVTMGYVNLIWQTDALAQIIQSIRLAAKPAQTINITGAGIFRVRELACRCAEFLQLEPIIVGHEQPTAWLSNAEQSHRLFGAPVTDIDTMQRWTAAWLLRDGPTWGKPTGFENREGKF